MYGYEAKYKPSIRADWGRYMAQKRKYERMVGSHREEEDVQSKVNELKSQITK